jgi:glycosyltransferase involved in cell wall biosynthesis
MIKKILWWGRFDPDYSRNRIVRNLLQKNRIDVSDFRPQSSFFATLESTLSPPKQADALWVPCFRQRDFNSARRFADKHRVSLIFDPLISSWDKVVFERQKYPATSRRALGLLEWERSLFRRSDFVVADTELHARFFVEQLSAPPDRTFVIPVGAETSLFPPQPPVSGDGPPEVLFYGSFIGLQGPQHIIEAARLVPEARWTLLGEGPLKDCCRKQAEGLGQVTFEDWLPYDRLAARIGKAAIVLGIFGESEKAGRVIPNKVYQALACSRPVVTRSSAAYPPDLEDPRTSGMVFVEPANPRALAEGVKKLLHSGENPGVYNDRAAHTYQTRFSESSLNSSLLKLLSALDC